MNVFKKIMLLVIIVGSASSDVFGMDNPGSNAFFDKVKGAFDEAEVIRGRNVKNFEIFYDAVSHGTAELVRDLLEAIPVEHRVVFVMNTLKGDTVLHRAIFNEYNTTNGQVAIVRVLLEAVPLERRAVFVMTKDKKGHTALHDAAFEGDVDIARLLLENLSEEQRVAFIMSRDKRGATALHYAAMCCQAVFARMLIEAIPTEQRVTFIMTNDFEGHTALHGLALSGHVADEIGDILEFVKMLIEAIPADQRAIFVMSEDPCGHTALQYAIVQGQKELVKMLKGYCQQQQEPEEEVSRKRTRDGVDESHVASKKREAGSGCNIM